MQKNKLSNGTLIALVFTIIAALTLFFPQILFFLSQSQRQYLIDFQQTYFTFFSGDGAGIEPASVAAIIILLVAATAISKLISFVSARLTLGSRHAETIKSLLVNCVKYAVVIYAIISALSIMGVNMVGIIAGLGIMGLIIGFGAQSLIEDVICGLFIIFEGQFHVGDIVSIDGFRGTVTAIGIRTTNLMDGGGNIKIINNSDIRTLTNLSEMDSFAISEIGISYQASIEDAEKAIAGLLASLPSMYPDVFRSKPQYSGVQELAQSAVILRVVANVPEPDIFKARRILNRELKLCMDRAGIEIPFMQVVVHEAK